MTRDGTNLGERVQRELSVDAPRLAGVLFGSSDPDARTLSERAYADYVRRNWPDSSFRIREADRNPDAFLRAFRSLGGVLPGESSPSPEAGAGAGPDGRG